MEKVGLKRDTIDKYYTKSSVVELCVEKIKEILTIKKEDLIIEPSAGNGAFISSIKELSHNNLFLDIEPENENIIKEDYLKWEVVKGSITHVIGNPPFGRQSSLAIKFIKKSCEYADTISFILPKSFKKDSLKKHFALNYHIVYEMEIQKYGFIVNNKEYDVPCIFQIWVKKIDIRNIPPKQTPLNFMFVKKEEGADISVRRVGVNAGKIDKNITDKSYQSHYFIKFEYPITDELYNKLSCINFEDKNNTVGPKSISKPELIKEFNLIMR